MVHTIRIQTLCLDRIDCLFKKDHFASFWQDWQDWICQQKHPKDILTYFMDFPCKICTFLWWEKLMRFFKMDYFNMENWKMEMQWKLKLWSITKMPTCMKQGICFCIFYYYFTAVARVGIIYGRQVGIHVGSLYSVYAMEP